MTKLLVCGDLHCKLDILQQVKERFRDGRYNKVIFLGDYVDDWNKPPEASYNLLTALLRFKKANPDKVVLLYGNHCLSEWLPRDFQCSGYNPNTHALVEPLYSRNQELFKLAYAENDILFTHAGVTNGWLKDNKIELPKENRASYLASILNEAFEKREADKEHNQLFRALATVGGMRGGTHNPSPLWADRTELIADAVPDLTQVVGHTPVKTITSHISRFQQGDSLLYFCDTHSVGWDWLFEEPVKISDNSLLEIEYDGSKTTWHKI